MYACADGLMELNAFVQLVSEFRREGDSEEEILEAFRVFDPQFTGVVSVTLRRRVRDAVQRRRVRDAVRRRRVRDATASCP